MENSKNKKPEQLNFVQNLLEKKQRPPITVFSSRRNSYSDLYLFKNQIELDGNGPILRPYSSEKTNVMMYRTIFLTLGVLYFFLALILFTKSLTWTCAMIFGSCAMVKSVLCTLCSSASIYCVGLGLLMRVEKETVKKAFSQSRTRLKKAYQRKALTHGINRYHYFLAGEEHKRSLGLKQIYGEALEKMQEYRDECLHIVERIAKTENLDGTQKESLLNQAVLECRDRMELVINSFKTTTPPKIQYQ